MISVNAATLAVRTLDCILHTRQTFSGFLPTVSMMEQMTAIRKRSETSVIGQIADDLLAWVSKKNCFSVEVQ